MLYYPQLASGAVCQFPVSQRTSIRTMSNELPGGDTIRMPDPGAAAIQWQLQYSSLTDNEWASIEQLFETVEGRLTTFTFLDPTDNLLAWSEDWTKSVWTTGPLLNVSSGIQDPYGASNAVQLTNTSQTAQRIVQTINGASSFQYCFSTYLRSDTPCTLQVVGSTAGEESLATVSAGPSWVRIARSVSFSTQHDGIGFGLQLPVGTRVEAFGAQVEAQPIAGQYKKSTDRGGVYANTRFASDSLRRTTDASNQNSCGIDLFSCLP